MKFIVIAIVIIIIFIFFLGFVRGVGEKTDADQMQEDEEQLQSIKAFRQKHEKDFSGEEK